MESGGCLRYAGPEAAKRARSRSRLVVAAFVCAAVASAIVPGVAAASTASISGGDELRYLAVAGEANNVNIAREGAVYRITDPGAAITPMLGCAPVTANEVTCTAAGVQTIGVELNDLNDSSAFAPSVTGVDSVNVNGGAGADTLNGGDGVESTLIGDTGADTLNAGALRDRLIGNDENDTLNGGAGPDSIEPGRGDDVANGGGGGDSIDGGSIPEGSDTLSGGPGLNDDVRYSSRSSGVNLTFDGAADDGGPAEGDNVMPDFERISTGSGNDAVLGGPLGERIFSGSGDDLVSGGGGDDDLDADTGNDGVLGEAGNDLLRGSIGDDAINGGQGDDTVRSDSFAIGSVDGSDVVSGGPGSDLMLLDGALDPLTVTLDGVADDGIAGEGDNLLEDMENVQGGFGPDSITGNASANQLGGGNGDDTLIGLSGSDGLAGDRGADSLDGGADNDLISGEAGDDRLRSRDAGPDDASCGAGADAVLADRDDEPGASCEQSSTGVAFGKAKLAGEKVKLALSCPQIEGVECAGTLTLRKGKKKIGDARFSVASGASEKVKVKLKGAGDASRLKLGAEAEMIDATGDRAVSEKRLVLKKGKT